MANGRPRFEQPPVRRCMWSKCPHLNMVSTDVNMCVRHAIIISQKLEANAKYQQQLEDDWRASDILDQTYVRNMDELTQPRYWR